MAKYHPVGMERPDVVSQLLADDDNNVRVHLGLQLPWQQNLSKEREMQLIPHKFQERWNSEV